VQLVLAQQVNGGREMVDVLALVLHHDEATSS